MDLRALAKKYGKAGPRYTSYPTVPVWTESVGELDYRRALAQIEPKNLSGDSPATKSFWQTDPGSLALYVHIPFCESLCYYCGCNIQISKSPSVSDPYLDRLLLELREVRNQMTVRGALHQISWGGGTPTFFTARQLEVLAEKTQEHFDIHDEAEVSIEIDPRVTSFEQLRVLRRIGFNRISLGVQDFDIAVQRAVNRLQSIEQTSDMLSECRRLGYHGINLDLIYGLPLQTLEGFQKTIDLVISLGPDRIALYNYAHLPALRPHQKILEKHALPQSEARLEIFTSAYEKLRDAKYVAIGMDHFARESDELSLALTRGRLHRNFMGYTVKRAECLIGVGASAISEINAGYFQNIRETRAYQDRVSQTGFATFRGCQAGGEDLRRKWVIQSLLCNGEIGFDTYEGLFGNPFLSHFEEELDELNPLFEDGILVRESNRLVVSPMGRLFVRNAAMVFDSYLKQPFTYSHFSQTV